MNCKFRRNIIKLCMLTFNLIIFSVFTHLSIANPPENPGSEKELTIKVKIKPSTILEKRLIPINIEVEPIAEDSLYAYQDLPKNMSIPKGTKAYRVVAKDVSGKIIEDRKINSKFTLELGYPDNIKPETAYNLKLFTLLGNRWLPLSSQVDTSHKIVKTEDAMLFGTYRLLAPVSAELKGIFVYPNPVQFGNFGGVNKTLKFRNIPLGSVIEIYTVTGEKIREIKETSDTEVPWNGKKDNGDLVTSGLYIYRIQTAGSESFGKIAVIR